jgi:hypothetical protein
MSLTLRCPRLSPSRSYGRARSRASKDLPNVSLHA